MHSHTRRIRATRPIDGDETSNHGTSIGCGENGEAVSYDIRVWGYTPCLSLGSEVTLAICARNHLGGLWTCTQPSGDTASKSRWSAPTCFTGDSCNIMICPRLALSHAGQHFAHHGLRLSSQQWWFWLCCQYCQSSHRSGSIPPKPLKRNSTLRYKGRHVWRFLARLPTKPMPFL